MSVPELLFVYGTLLSGGSHHRLLNGGDRLGAWVSGPHYRMLDMGPYPALIEGDGRVIGEIYRIEREMLAALDIYEGCPGDYRREQTDTEFGVAWIYLWDRLPTDAIEVVGGDWLKYLEQRNLPNHMG